MKYCLRMLAAICVLSSVAYAASDATAAQKLEYRAQAANWIAGYGVCGFQLNSNQVQIYIVKLIGDLKDPLLKEMKEEALDAVEKLSALNDAEKSEKCSLLYKQAKAFDIYK